MLRLLLVLLLASGASAQGITYGDALPMADAALASADGSQTTLSASAGAAGLVVVFWSNACPWTDRYAPRLADLAERYTPAGIGFVLVNANDPAQSDRESATASREHATGAGLVMPYLADPSGALATAFGASSAPHVFFFDAGRVLRYDGTLDDSPASADRVRVPYLAQAMDQSVAGLPIEVQRTQAFGCALKQTTD